MEEIRNSNGQFKKGHGGTKPKGAIGETQKAIRNALGDFVTGKLESLDEIFEATPAKDQGRLLMSMVEFLLPKMRESHVTTEDLGPKASFDYTKLSPSALKEVLSLTTIDDGTNEG